MDVTIKTLTKNNDERNVTLWLNPDNSVMLLGGLPHGTTIIINQKFVDDLQKLLNVIESNK